MKELQYPFDGAWILKNRRKIKKAFLQDGTVRMNKKIAVLGGSTTRDIISIMELFLLDMGIQPTFYESEYARYWQDAMFENPELEEFSPDLIFIHTTTRNITEFPSDLTCSEKEVNLALERQYQHFAQMWERLSSVYKCPIIQNNFEFPAYRLLGNSEASNIHGKINFITRLNQKFYDYANSHTAFYIHDIQYLSACYGLDRWLEPSYWYLYKYALCVPAIPDFAYQLTRIMQSIYGKNKKVLALDLDNTLWGGVIGDDGVEGIEICHETNMGQAYEELQGYLKSHKDLGILLTVCSKNEEENAIAGLNHPSCILKPDDFVVIKANWNSKDQNILQTAQELNLLPESFVFVDDNPAERAIVEGQNSGIAIPEFDCVEECLFSLDRAGYFEVTALSKDDAKRNDMYKANAQRIQLQQTFSNYTEYLESLEMKASIIDFEPIYLQRIVQLTNKSNQFNLTTKRYTQSEMESVVEAGNKYIRLCGSLQDKFGDNGIVSIVIGEKIEDVLNIDLWLMSCRVLKRDMEFAMLDELVRQAKNSKIKTIMGYYYKTAKNAMVKSLYETFGFTLEKAFENGDSVWRLEVASYKNKNHVIKVNDEKEQIKS
ncbi:MAG: HAD-IIIC family phosphatase [Ruminococcus sp.]|nr:HAD-IIIC family phosphatase [Ruminococcus sp.]